MQHRGEHLYTLCFFVRQSGEIELSKWLPEPLEKTFILNLPDRTLVMSALTPGVAPTPQTLPTYRDVCFTLVRPEEGNLMVKYVEQPLYAPVGH